MKKLFCLSFALLAFGFQGSVAATESPDELVDNFCQEVDDLGINEEAEVAEMVRSYISELDNPTIDQIVALSQIAVDIEDGESMSSICGDDDD